MRDTDRDLLNTLKEIGIHDLFWDCYAYNDEYEFVEGSTRAYNEAGEAVSVKHINLFGLQDIAYATFDDFTGRFHLKPQTGKILRLADVYLPEDPAPVVDMLSVPEEAIAVTREEVGI